MNGLELTDLLERQAEALPPPQATAIETVLRAGTRRRMVRRSVYAAASIVAVLTGILIGGRLVAGPEPADKPQITSPFGPALATVAVCEQPPTCQPVDREILARVIDTINGSGVAEVINVRDGHDVATDFLADAMPEGFAETMPSLVVFRINPTPDPMPLFRSLTGLPGTIEIAIGTADIAPSAGPGDEDNSPPAVEYAQLDVPVEGRAETVRITTYRDQNGLLCLRDPDGTTCGWTRIAPGVLSGGVGPYTEAPRQRHCGHWLAGFDVDRITIQLGDGTSLDTTSITARADLAYPRLHAACWVGPATPVTMIAYNHEGQQIQQSTYDPAATPSP